MAVKFLGGANVEGNVGIGTTSPSSKLHVNGDVKVGTNISVNNTFGNKASNQGINFESPTTALQTARVDSDAFRFYFGGTGGGGEVLRILEGGNVGIGTTSPSEKFHIYHPTTNTLAYLQSGDATTILAMADNGGSIEIKNTSGNLIFETGGNANTAGSSTSEVMRITSDGNVDVTGNLTLDDNSQLRIGTSNDLRLLHDGTDSFINLNGSGHFYIQQFNDDKDIVFNCDNGSGGLAQYIRIDGSAQLTQFDKNTKHADSVLAGFGNGNDLQIYHDGTNSVLNNIVGNLQIYQQADDADIQFICDDGSGGVTEYFRLDGGAVATIFSKNTQHADNVKAYFGNAVDLEIYHDGSNSYIVDTGTGDLNIQADNNINIKKAGGGETKAVFTSDGAVELYYDDSKKFETTSSGVAIDGSLSLGDSDTIYLGNSNDLKIYHNGSHSYILDDGTGELRLNSGNAVRIRKHDNETMALFTADGAAELYYDNSKKFETSSSGANVTGSFEATSFITSTGSYIRSQYNTSHWSQLESNASGGVIKAVDGGVTTILLRSYGDSYFTGGKLGVGTNSPAEDLEVVGSNPTIKVRANATNWASFDIESMGNQANYVFFRDDSAERARITVLDNESMNFYTGGGSTLGVSINSNGNVGIGETSIDAKLHLTTGGSGLVNQKFESNGSAAWRIGVPAGSTSFVFDNANDNLSSAKLSIDASGNVTAAADITAYSDERLKEDIKPLEGSLEKVQAIEGVSFVKKNDEHKKQKIGFIAQQLKEVLPEVVHENEDGIHSVAYGNITALLVEAVKEQQEIIAQLEERIIDLENRL